MSIQRILFLACLSSAVASVGFAQTANEKDNDSHTYRMLGPKTPGPTDKPPSNPRTLTGVVRDEKDEPVQGALVTVKSRRTEKIRTMVTKPDGTYSFDLLRRDEDYEVTAKLRKAESGVKILSTFNTVLHPRIDLKLEPKSESAQKVEQK